MYAVCLYHADQTLYAARAAGAEAAPEGDVGHTKSPEHCRESYGLGRIQEVDVGDDAVGTYQLQRLSEALCVSAGDNHLVYLAMVEVQDLLYSALLTRCGDRSDRSEKKDGFFLCVFCTHVEKVKPNFSVFRYISMILTSTLHTVHPALTKHSIACSFRGWYNTCKGRLLMSAGNIMTGLCSPQKIKESAF